MLHPNDKQNQRKHRKMVRREEHPKKFIHPNSIWAKKRRPQVPLNAIDSPR